MTVKDIVDDLLKKEKRSASWLSKEMGMTPDGLRLGLLKESIKYSSIVQLCGILGVKAGVLFGEGEVLRTAIDDKQGNDDRQLVRLLKEQVRDKQLIIDLLIKERRAIRDE